MLPGTLTYVLRVCPRRQPALTSNQPQFTSSIHAYQAVQLEQILRKYHAKLMLYFHLQVALFISLQESLMPGAYEYDPLDQTVNHVSHQGSYLSGEWPQPNFDWQRLNWMKHQDPEEHSHRLVHYIQRVAQAPGQVYSLMEQRGLIALLPEQLRTPQFISGNTELYEASPYFLLLEEGSSNDRAFMPVEGKLLVLKRNMHQAQFHLIDICESEADRHSLCKFVMEYGSILRQLNDTRVLLGEQSVISGKPVSATVVSRTNSRLLYFSRQLTLLLGQQQRRIRKELSEHLRPKFAAFFHNSSFLFIDNTLKLFDKVSISRQSVLLREGQKATRIMLILSGSCLISRNYKGVDVSVALLGDKETVGLQYIDRSSQYKYTAKSSIEAVSISMHHFWQLPARWRRALLQLGQALFSKKSSRDSLFQRSTEAINRIDRGEQLLTPRVKIPSRANRNSLSWVDQALLRSESEPIQIYIELPVRKRITHRKQVSTNQSINLTSRHLTFFKTKSKLSPSTRAVTDIKGLTWSSGFFHGVDPTQLAKRTKRFKRKLVMYSPQR